MERMNNYVTQLFIKAASMATATMNTSTARVFKHKGYLYYLNLLVIVTLSIKMYWLLPDQYYSKTSSMLACTVHIRF